MSQTRWFLLHERVEALWLARQLEALVATAQEAWTVADHSFPPEHPLRIRAGLDLAVALHTVRRLDEATRTEEEAGALDRRLLERAQSHPDALSTADWLLFDADRRWAVEGDSDELRGMINRAVAIRTAHLGHRHPLLGEAFAQRGEWNYLSGNFASAQSDFRSALETFDSQPSFDSLWPVRARRGLALSLVADEKWNDAKPIFECVLADALFSELSSETRYALLHGYSEVLSHLGDVAGAERAESRAAALLPKTNPGAEGFHV